MKKALSVFLAVVLILSLMSVTAAPFEAVKSSKIKTSDDNSGESSISWSYNDGTLTISGNGPIEYRYQKEPWYSYAKDITSLVIEKGITSIGDYAFGNYYDNLKDISLPDTLRSIEADAFRNAESIERVKIPDSVERIGDSAFRGCSSLESVYLGKNLYVLDGNPFSLTKLSNITVSSENKVFTFKDNILVDDENGLVCYPCILEEKTFTVPEYVEKIYDYAMSGNKNIETINVSSCVKEIGRAAFANCNRLKEVNLNEGLVEIGQHAFSSCDVQSIFIPSTVTCIGENVFQYCHNLSGINVSPTNSMYKVVNGVLFDKSGKELIDYPEGKTDEKYDIPDTVTHISNYAFSSNYNLKTVTFPDGLEEIGDSAFFYCKNLEGEIIIPDKITVIESGVFGGDDKISKVVLGNSIEKIEGSAFAECGELEVYFKGHRPSLGLGGSFRKTDLTLYYPDGDRTWLYVRSETEYGDSKSFICKTWDTPVLPIELKDISIDDPRYCEITLSETRFNYDGKTKKPEVKVVYENSKYFSEPKTLQLGKDYTVTYINNINVGTASVKVEGIGSFVDSKTLNFEINKGHQKVTASVENPEIEVGQTTRITASGIGKIEYLLFHDSDEDIISVDENGVVTGKKEGTAEIHVKAKGDQNYYAENADTIYVTVKKKPKLTIDKLSYNFSNSYKGFHYKYPYKMPLSSYKIIFDDREAQEHYDSNGEWNGNCYGMASSSMMFNVENSPLKLSLFNQSAKSVKDLNYNDYSSYLKFDITALNEAMLNIQFVHDVSSTERLHRNDIIGLISEVKKCDKSAPAVMIGFLGNGGHEVLGYKYEKINSQKELVHIYDSNYPLEDRYITFEKNSRGEYTNWYYDGGGHYYAGSTHKIDWSNYALISEAWNNRNSAKDYKTNYTKMTVANSDNFEIQDNNGNTLAEMKNGELSNSNESIFEVSKRSMDSNDEHIIYLPKNLYTVVDNDNNDKKLVVTMSDDEQSVKVKTESDTVKLFTDDNQAANIASVDGAGGEKYAVELNSDLECAKEAETVVYEGKKSDKELSVGTSYGELVASNYTRTGVKVEESVIKFSRESDKDISECKAVLEKDNFTYTGTSIEPKVTVTAAGGEVLTEGYDYTVVYAGSSVSGTATAIVYGINDYKGRLEANYTINAVDISNFKAELTQSKFEYDDTLKTPGVVVENGSNVLYKDKDYSVSYENNLNAGTAKVIIKGINGYNGSITKPFSIVDSNRKTPTPKVTSKKANPIKVTVKTKTVKAKKLKKKAQKVKAVTVKNAQGKVTYKLVKSGITKKIRKLVKINSKGVITIKKWKKAKKGTCKIKVKITAKGNTNYKAKTVTKTVKVKLK